MLGGAGTFAGMSEKDPGRLADQREHEADELARRSDELKDKVSDVKQDWEHKRASESVPGAVPPEDNESERSDPAGQTDGEKADGAR